MRISDWSSDVCSSDLGATASLLYFWPFSLPQARQSVCLTSLDCLEQRQGGYRYFQSELSASLYKASTISHASSAVSTKWKRFRRSEARRVVKELSVRVDLGGGRCITKKNKQKTK